MRELTTSEFEITNWYGQRFVHRLLAVRPVRLFEVLRCRILGSTSKRYFEANDPKVDDIPRYCTARYFVAVAKKII